jgi:subfamily B ATP-binding cassette protein MsbA
MTGQAIPETRPRSVLGNLLRLTQTQFWLIPALVGTGLLAFAFEGLAIYLLWPLLQFLSGSAASASSNPLIRHLTMWAASFGPGESVPVLIAAIVTAITLKGVTALASEIAFNHAVSRVGDDLRRRCFGDILSADQAFLEDQPPGALLNTLATETWRFSQGLQVLSRLILHACAVAIFIGLMVLLSVRLTVIVAVGVAAIFALVGFLTRSAQKYGAVAVAANEQLAARIVESLAGLRTIRLFGREGYERGRFQAASDRVRRAFLKMEIVNAVPASVLEILFAGFLGVLLLTLRHGDFTSLLVFVALLLRLQPHAAALMHARVGIAALAGAAQNVVDLSERAQALPLKSGVTVATSPAQAIAFRGVEYTYPGARWRALKGMEFEIPARGMTALVGPSGAGKSTVLALLCRLADPDRGTIEVDGRSLQDLDLLSWRERCAVVPQEVFLFNTTVRENIAYGRLDATDAQIEAAARAAHAHEFIAMLPRGYDTRVGDRGVQLSGGQRQRIALARAFVHGPDVLILDEATNALDAMSETLVRDALEQSGRDRTVIVVAHRLSSIERADKVIVLDGGEVVETGTPAQLMRSGTLFHRMFAATSLAS